MKKKLLIIYRSGERVTVEYNEEKCDVFKEMFHKDRNFEEPIALSFIPDGVQLFIRVDQISHAEVI